MIQNHLPSGVGVQVPPGPPNLNRIDMSFDRKTFWDNKILVWEKDRYKKNSQLSNSSVQYRLDIAKNILKQIPDGWNVLELGCGSCLSIQDLPGEKKINYTGIDIAESAIKNAKEKFKSSDNHHFKFISTDIANFKSEEKYDLCFSLGFLDWIELNEIDELKKKINTNYYFHSYSEKRTSLAQMIHKAYVYLAYAYKTKSYRPKYYSEELMKGYFPHSKFYRNPQLSFGTLLYHLPDNIKF
jgi:2-polyprenyl-3-methyl-5-hydroxy-6-metoxy-1,4-benzoquinol methylase